MTKLDKDRRLVAERIKKFEKTAQDIHEMADKLHHKIEKLHLETIATRERARSAREHAESKTRTRKRIVARPRKGG